MKLDDQQKVIIRGLYNKYFRDIDEETKTQHENIDEFLDKDFKGVEEILIMAILNR